MKKPLKVFLAVIALILASSILVFSILALTTEVGSDERVVKYIQKVKAKQFLSEQLKDESISEDERNEMIKTYTDEIIQMFVDADFDMADENIELNNNMDSYNVVIEYLVTLMEKNPERERMCFLFIVNSKKGCTLSDVGRESGRLDVPKEVSQALFNIDKSFSKQGYFFDGITIENGVMTFDSTDGRHDLLYKMDKKVKMKMKYKSGVSSYIVINSNIDNWYHLVTTQVSNW